jgi:hypothetical protein
VDSLKIPLLAWEIPNSKLPEGRLKLAVTLPNWKEREAPPSEVVVIE